MIFRLLRHSRELVSVIEEREGLMRALMEMKTGEIGAMIVARMQGREEAETTITRH